MNGHLQFDDVDTRPLEDWPAEGLYEGLPAEEYHALEGRASSSILRRLVTKTPAHAKALMEDDSDPTKAMRFGTMMHEAVLEPDQFAQNYAVSTDCHATTGSGDRCKSSGKVPYRTTEGDVLWFCGRSSHQPDEYSNDWNDYVCEYCGADPGERCKTESGDLASSPHANRRYAAQQWTVDTYDGEVALEGPADVETITESEAEKIDGMRQALQAHPAAKQLLFDWDGLSELSMTWTHEATGVPCKARVDRVVHHPTLGRVAVDYKTTRDAEPSPFAFGKAIDRHRYDMQGGVYSWGLAAQGVPVEAFLIVAQEKSPPYGVSVLYLPGSKMDPGDTSEPDLESAQDDVLYALRQYKQSAKTGDWPAYSSSIVAAEVPTYADAGTPREDRR